MQNKIVLLALFGILILGGIGYSQDVYAVNYLPADLCEKYKQTVSRDATPPTKYTSAERYGITDFSACFILKNNDGLIKFNADDTLTIPGGQMVSFGGGEYVNNGKIIIQQGGLLEVHQKATLINNNIIENNGFVSYSKFKWNAVPDNSHQFTLASSIIGGFLPLGGSWVAFLADQTKTIQEDFASFNTVIKNSSDAIFTNNMFLMMKGKFENNGLLENSKTGMISIGIDNRDLCFSKGFAKLTNTDGGKIINKGNIANNDNLENYGTIENDGGLIQNTDDSFDCLIDTPGVEVGGVIGEEKVLKKIHAMAGRGENYNLDYHTTGGQTLDGNPNAHHDGIFNSGLLVNKHGGMIVNQIPKDLLTEEIADSVEGTIVDLALLPLDLFGGGAGMILTTTEQLVGAIQSIEEYLLVQDFPETTISNQFANPNNPVFYIGPPVKQSPLSTVFDLSEYDPEETIPTLKITCNDGNYAKPPLPAYALVGTSSIHNTGTIKNSWDSTILNLCYSLIFNEGIIENDGSLVNRRGTIIHVTDSTPDGSQFSFINKGKIINADDGNPPTGIREVKNWDPFPDFKKGVIRIYAPFQNAGSFENIGNAKVVVGQNGLFSMKEPNCFNGDLAGQYDEEYPLIIIDSPERTLQGKWSVIKRPDYCYSQLDIDVNSKFYISDPDKGNSNNKCTEPEKNKGCGMYAGPYSKITNSGEISNSGQVVFHNEGVKFTGNRMNSIQPIIHHTPSNLLIGAPGEAIKEINNAGAAHLLIGGDKGLQSKNNDKMFYESFKPEDTTPKQGERFGNSLVVGDFNGDGEKDIAIGVPFQDEAGSAYVFFGEDGIISTSNYLSITQWELEGTPEPGDEFGWSLASGDFNADGYDDLAIGAPREKIGEIEGGAVNVVYGGHWQFQELINDMFFKGDGISGKLNYIPPTGNDPGKQELFGNALASGDFNCDGRDDLAIGAPGDLHADEWGGSVYLKFGQSEKGLSKGTTTDLRLYQGWGPFTGGPETGDEFGHSLAVGDFNGDGCDDLAIGAPGESIGDIKGGAVQVLIGGKNLNPNNKDYKKTPMLYQSSHKALDEIHTPLEHNDQFGASLAAGDFDGDGYDDLAIGSPGEKIGSVENAGVVQVLKGTPKDVYNLGISWGLDTNTDLGIFYKGSGTLPGKPFENESFGASLAAGDFNGDGRDDLAIGAPKLLVDYIKAPDPKKLVEEAGGIMVVDSMAILTQNSFLKDVLQMAGKDNTRFYAQFISGIEGMPEMGDGFGFSLAAMNVEEDDFEYDYKYPISYKCDFGHTPELGCAYRTKITIVGVPMELCADRVTWIDPAKESCPPMEQCNDGTWIDPTKTTCSTVATPNTISTDLLESEMEDVIESKVLSPYKQIAFGVSVDDVKCKLGFEKATHQSSDKPICVKPSSIDALIKRGVILK